MHRNKIELKNPNKFTDLNHAIPRPIPLDTFRERFMNYQSKLNKEESN